jgi:hypothetical protein
MSWQGRTISPDSSSKGGIREAKEKDPAWARCFRMNLVTIPIRTLILAAWVAVSVKVLALFADYPPIVGNHGFGERNATALSCFY